MSDPYTPPREALQDEVEEPPLVEGSAYPEALAAGPAILGWCGAAFCGFAHSCMCGHLAHDRQWWPDVPIDVVTFLLIGFASGVLLLARSRLRVVAALLFLTTLPAALRMLTLFLGLIGLVILMVSAMRAARGPR